MAETAQQQLEKSREAFKGAVKRASTKQGPDLVIDQKTIMSLVDEILKEGFEAGQKAMGTARPKTPQLRKVFSFDYAALQENCRKKMAAEGHDWDYVAGVTGIPMNHIRRHFGPTPPKEMGVKVVISLMVYLQDFDLIGYLLEDQ